MATSAPDTFSFEEAIGKAPAAAPAAGASDTPETFSFEEATGQHGTQMPLPEGVQPAAGRMSNDPRRLDAPPDNGAAQLDAMRSGDLSGQIDYSQPAPRESVLQDQVLPDAPPNLDEAARLSRRDYAEATPMRDTSAISPSRMPRAAPPNRSREAGENLQDASMARRTFEQLRGGAVEAAGGAVRAGAELYDQTTRPDTDTTWGRLGIDAASANPVINLTRTLLHTMFGIATGGKEQLPSTDQVARVAGGIARGAKDFQTGMGDPTLTDQTFGPKSPVPYLAKQAEGAASSLGSSAVFAVGFGARSVIPLMTVQSAGQQYQAAREAGLEPGQALANALPYGAFEAIGEKFQGLDKAAAALRVLMTRGAPAQAIKDAGQVLIHSGVREVPGEVITYLGQTGVDLLPGIGLNPNLTVGQFIDGLTDTVVQAGMMGVTSAGGGAWAAANARRPVQQTPEQLARAKGFLVAQEQIDRVKKAGEKELSTTMQRELDTQRADSELEQLQDKTWAQDEGFRTQYKALRTGGMPPAEAASRASMAAGFGQMGRQMGLDEAAVGKAVQAAGKLPLDKVPAFFEAFTASLVKKGVVEPIPDGTVSGAVAGLRDDAAATALQDVYGEAPPTATMDAITALENGTAPAATQAPAGETQEATGEATDAGAHLAATSPKNDLPEPTDAQKQAGNYKVGRLRIAGLDVSIENPEGSTRSGVDADGKPWSNTMRSHYGYVRQSQAADGDHVDTFVKPGTSEDFAGPAFVVDQIDPKTGRYDEAKVVLGAANRAEAEALYRANYAPGWKGLGAITELPMEQFKQWVQSDAAKRPLDPTIPAAAPAAPAPTDAGAALAGTATPAVTGASSAGVPADGKPGAVGKVDHVTGKPAGSWVIVDKGTGKVVMETFDAAKVDALNTAKYKAVPAGEYLHGISDQKFGRDHVPVAFGGKPFTTRAEADKARKLQHGMRVVQAPREYGKGYVLTPMTEAQLAAQAKAAKRLAAGATEKKGEPVAAHGFIAGRGGIAVSAMSELGFDKNVRVGSRWLFARDGGMTLEQATELLHQHGYIRDEDQRAAIETLARSAKGQPQYTPEGWEQIAAAENATRYDDHLAAVEEEADPFAPLADDDLQDTGWHDLTAEEQRQFAALVRAAETEGIDTDAILEEAHYITKNGTLHDYHAEVKRLLDAARAQRGAASAGDGRGEPAATAGGGQRVDQAERPGGEGGEQVHGQAGDDAARNEAQAERSRLTAELVDIRRRIKVLEKLRACVAAGG